MLRSSVGFNSVLLGAFALITAGVLAVTHAATKERITEAELSAARQALLEIVPADRHDNDLLTDTQEIDPAYLSLLGLTEASDMYIARRAGEAVAIIVPSVAPEGYSGAIRLLVGVNRDGSVAGVRVVSHKETPGLGDKVELRKDDWILSFDGRSLNNPPLKGWAVKKDGGVFDQFTGATITPRALVHQVKNVLQYVAEAQPFAHISAAPRDASSHTDLQP